MFRLGSSLRLCVVLFLLLLLLGRWFFLFCRGVGFCLCRRVLVRIRLVGGWACGFLLLFVLYKGGVVRGKYRGFGL